MNIYRPAMLVLGLSFGLLLSTAEAADVGGLQLGLPANVTASMQGIDAHRIAEHVRFLANDLLEGRGTGTRGGGGLRTVEQWRSYLARYSADFLQVAADEDAEDANTALCECFEGDAVQNCDRLVRTGGSISFPPVNKREKGYVTELTTVQIKRDAPSYSVEALCALRPTKSKMTGCNVDTGSASLHLRVLGPDDQVLAHADVADRTRDPRSFLGFQQT